MNEWLVSLAWAFARFMVAVNVVVVLLAVMKHAEGGGDARD